MRLRPFLALALFATPLAAQGTQAPSPVADARALWTDVRDYVLQSAIDMPEAKYSYRPTPDVRTFGELIAHIAGSQSMFCAMALGTKPPAEDAVESKTQTKAALVDALKKSNADCVPAYAQADAAVASKTDMFGRPQTRLYALLENATHDNEHYGNIVTYFRLNGMVPPSSRPTTGK